jgi:hypothetical protein
MVGRVRPGVGGHRALRRREAPAPGLGSSAVVAVARFRMSRTALLPVGLLLLCVIPAAAASPWALLLLLLPALAAAWVLRTGLDVAGDTSGEDEPAGGAGVTVRSLVGRRHVPWPEVAGLRVGARGELWLVTTGGTEVRLPVVRLRDLDRLSAASGGRIPAPGNSSP